MELDLYVAIFDDAERAEPIIAEAIHTRASLSENIKSLTLFNRTATGTVRVLVPAQHQDGQWKIGPVGEFDAATLTRLLPDTADWKIISTAHGLSFPETMLNSKFAAYLQVVAQTNSTSAFFIPQSPQAGEEFLSGFRPHASIIIHTTMSLDDVQRLRGTLQHMQ